MSMVLNDWVTPSTALMQAAAWGSEEDVRAEIEREKTAIDQQDPKEGMTALLFASRRRDPHTLPVVRELLKAKADVSKQNSDGWTALMVAVVTSEPMI